MARLDRVEALVPDLVQGPQGGDGLPHGKGELMAGAADPLLTDLEIGNVARAIANGEGVGSWQLGAAIGKLLARREGQ